MIQGISLVLLLASVIIIIGSLASYLFRRTGIPDMLFLVFLGIIFGPILGIIHLDDIAPLAPFLTVLALIIILLDGGLSLSLRRTIIESPRAVALAFLSFIISVLALAFIVKYTLGWRWSDGLLLGSILGGSSSVVIVSLAPKIGISEQCSTTIVFESAISDVLSTVATLTLIGIMLSGLPPIDGLIRIVSTRFSTGAVVGVILGLIWLGSLSKLRGEPYRYMLTLAVLFLGYMASEYLGGSGVLSALMFGIVLGNDKEISNFIYRSERSATIDDSFKRLEAEIAFLIKTFFFVYLGLIVSFPNIVLLIYGIILSLVLLLVRYVAVHITTLQSSLKNERGVMGMMFSRGLAAAVLSVLPQQLGLPNAEIYIPIVLIVILGTAIITSLGVSYYSRRIKP